jgi:hypothetical protein
VRRIPYQCACHIGVSRKVSLCQRNKHFGDPCASRRSDNHCSNEAKTAAIVIIPELQAHGSSDKHHLSQLTLRRRGRRRYLFPSSAAYKSRPSKQNTGEKNREKTPDAELLAGYAQLSSISTHAYNSRQPEPIHKSSYIRIHPISIHPHAPSD